jgi:uncharacterized protein YaiI (UPF0178 family)
VSAARRVVRDEETGGGRHHRGLRGRESGYARPVIDIYVDADACPVKDEIYDVAGRSGLYVFVVANSRMKVPSGAGVEMVVVAAGPDAADDWIAEHVRKSDVVVTGDIPLAARCLEVGARVLGTNGRPFTEDSIGGALATRELKSELREAGVASGGPPPLSQKDRSRFLSALDQQVQAGLRDERDARERA